MRQRILRNRHTLFSPLSSTFHASRHQTRPSLNISTSFPSHFLPRHSVTLASPCQNPILLLSFFPLLVRRDAPLRYPTHSWRTFRLQRVWYATAVATPRPPTSRCPFSSAFTQRTSASLSFTCQGRIANLCEIFLFDGRM